MAGPVNILADTAGVDAGPPDGVYEIVDPPPTDAALYPLDPAHDVDAVTSHIAEFFQRGRREL